MPVLDRHLLPLQTRILERPAAHLAGLGVRADAITLVGFAVGLAAVPFLTNLQFIPALLCILSNRALDGLDGAVARIHGPTDRGAFLDISLDFVFYGAVPLGFALADPAANAVAAATLLLAFIGTGSSFLAYAAISHRRGEAVQAYPGKGIRFIGGLTEGTETIMFFCLFCLFPAAFAPLAYVFASLAGMTAATRWWWGWNHFASPATAK